MENLRKRQTQSKSITLNVNENKADAVNLDFSTQMAQSQSNCVNCHFDLNPSSSDRFPLDMTMTTENAPTIFQLIYQFFRLYSPNPSSNNNTKLVADTLVSNQPSYAVCTNCFDKLYLLNELVLKLYADTKFPSILSKVLLHHEIPESVPFEIKTEVEEVSISDAEIHGDFVENQQYTPEPEADDDEFMTETQGQDGDGADSDYELPVIKRPKKSNPMPTRSRSTKSTPKLNHKIVIEPYIYIKKTNPKRPFSCPNCCATFTQSCHYKRHATSFHSSKEVKCKECKGTFNSKSSLDYHLNSYHHDRIIDNDDEDEEKKQLTNKAYGRPRKSLSRSCKNEIPKGNRDYEMSENDVDSDNQSMGNPVDEVDDSQDINFEPNDTLELGPNPRAGNSKIEHEISKDGTTTTKFGKKRIMQAPTSKDEVDHYIKTNDTRRPISCPNCCATFTRSSHYKRHAISFHTSKDINCKQCKGTFNNDWSLNYHLNSYHPRKLANEMNEENERLAYQAQNQPRKPLLHSPNTDTSKSYSDYEMSDIDGYLEDIEPATRSMGNPEDEALDEENINKPKEILELDPRAGPSKTDHEILDEKAKIVKKPKIKAPTPTSKVVEPYIKSTDFWRPISCPNCCQTFTQSGHYKRHAISFHSSKDISCKDCKGTFSSESSLNYHLQSYHPLKFWSKNKENEEKLSDQGQDNKLNSSENLKEEIMDHENFGPENETDSESSNYEPDEIFGIDSGPSSIKIAHPKAKIVRKRKSQALLPARKEIEPYIKTTDLQRPVSCPNCCATFTRSSHYTRHAVSFHTSKDINCEDCKGTFNNPSSLNYHLKSYHPGKYWGKNKEEKENPKEAKMEDEDSEVENETDSESSNYEPDEIVKTDPGSGTIKIYQSVSLKGKLVKKDPTTSKLSNEIQPFIRTTDLRRPYSCPNCCATFNKIPRYRRHAISSHSYKNNKKFSSKKCTGTFNSSESLKNHLKFYHRKTNENDDQKTYRSELVGNIDVDPPIKNSKSAKPYSCPNCCAKYVSYYRYKRHAVVCHSSKDISCSKCKGTFSSEATLQAHIRLYHSGSGNEIIEEETGPGTDSEGDAEEGELYYPRAKPIPKVCPECDQEFGDKYQLKRHLANEHGIIVETKLQCPVCPRRCATQEVLDAHMDKYHLVRIQERIYECHICNQKYFRKSHLTRHMPKHTDERNFICEFCGFAGKKAEHLSRHIEQVHNKPARFTCPTCGKSFVRKHHLIGHQVTHTDSKNYLCDECGKSFRSQNNLRQHRQTHEHVRYNCDYCTNTYSRSAYLTKHIKSAHKEWFSGGSGGGGGLYDDDSMQ